MPHSQKTRAKVSKIKRDLNKRIKSLQKLKCKHLSNSYEITLPQVSLGDLRKRWSLQQKELHPAVLRNVKNFVRLPTDSNGPLFIYGSDGGLLACRVRLQRPELVQQLSASIDQLPSKISHYKYRGINRGEYQTRHLGVWAPYMVTPKYTKEHREHVEAHDNFLRRNSELWYEISALLGQVAPNFFKELLRYPAGEGLDRGCDAWAACVVNNGGNNPNQTNIHRDVKESQYGYSCVISCGDFTGGDLILYELGYILEVAPGDVLLFPDSLISHSNEPAQGNRKSVVTFTQENMFDYWHRQYGMKLKRQVARDKLVARKEEESARKRLERVQRRRK